MKTFDANQQAIIDADYKTVSWFFEVSSTYIDYDAKPSDAKFTVGNSLYQMVDGEVTAQGTIEKHERFTQSTGRLHLSGILGTFVDDYPVYEATYGGELCTNPELTTDTTDFAASAGDSIARVDSSSDPGVDSTTAGASDKYCLKVTNASGAGEAQGGYDKSIFTAGDFYIASLIAYSPSANTSVGYDQLRLDLVTGSVYSSRSGIDDTWNTHTVVAQATGTRMILSVGGFTDFGDGDILYGDKFSIKKITNAAMCNGDQQGDLYYWSTKFYEHGGLTFDYDPLTFGADEIVFGNDYTYKVIIDSFDGIEVNSPLSQLGVYAPNTLSFDIDNSDESLVASDFVNSRVLLSLAMESDSTHEVMRQWKYIVDQSNSVYGRIKFYCKDFIAKNMEGDYPSTPLSSDLFSPLSSDSSLVDSEPFCVPIPFGTAYIPLQVVSDSAYNRGYLLGPSDYTYTVTEVSSPRDFNAAQVWESTDADFRQDTKSDRFDPSDDWKVLYPYLAKMDENSYAGSHTGANDAATLTDSTKSWAVDSLIGLRIVNDTDGSSGYITDNDATTVTTSLSGGTDDDFDTGDSYHIEMTGLWVVNGEYQNLLVKFSRSDLSSTTDPADHIEYVLEDIGIGSGNIDTGSGSTFETASTTYTSWGLEFNGAYYYRQPTPKVISSLLNQSHSTLDVDSKVEIRTLSKTSQQTLTDADILKGSFKSSYLTKSEYDSGLIAFQEDGKPQDIFQKLTVPAKNTWDNPSSDVFEITLVQDSQVAQALGMLKYQREYLRESNETFDAKSSCLALQPNDVITINHSNYGPSHDVLIESMHIHRDASITFRCVKFSLALDDFDDLSPSAVSVTSDGNTTYWQPVVSGPDSLTPGTGNIPHVLPGSLRIGGSGDYIYIDATAKSISSSNYVSGVTGSGFFLDSDLLEVGNIACRGVIRTAVFQKDVVSVIGGNLLVRPGDVLATDMTAEDVSTLTIEGNETFSVDDILRIKDGSDDEWLIVTDAGSAPTYTVTRDLDAQYGADSNPAWTKGATVVNYGQSGDGGILLTSSESNAPHIDIFTHAGSPYDTTITRVRIGNLNGFLSFVSDLYGIAMGESGKSLSYDPTNGLILTGPGIEVGTSGYFRSAGKTSYADTDAGIWIGYDSGEYKINIGDASSYITWDGSNLTITGGVAASTVEVGTSGYVRTTGKTSYADTDAGFWLGYDSGAYKLNIGDATYYMKWTGTALQVAGQFLGATVGDIVEASDVPEKTFNQGSGSGYQKHAEFTIGRGGAYRITWEHEINFGGGYTLSTRVYRNGTGVGTTKTATSAGSYEAESDDVSGWSPGDLLQLYCITDYGPGGECKLKNIRVKSSNPMMTTTVEEDV